MKHTMDHFHGVFFITFICFMGVLIYIGIYI